MKRKLPEQILLHEGKARIDRVNEVEAELEVLGLRLPEKPTMYDKESGEEVEYYGQLPDDIANLDDLALFSEMEKQTKWGNYIAGQLAKADVARKAALAKEKLAEAKIRLDYRTDEEGTQRSVQDSRDLQEADRSYVEIKSEVLVAEARYLYIAAIAQAAEDSYKALSRRITQKGQELERDRRTTAVGNYKTPQQPNGRTRRF